MEEGHSLRSGMMMMEGPGYIIGFLPLPSFFFSFPPFSDGGYIPAFLHNLIYAKNKIICLEEEMEGEGRGTC